MFRAFAQELGEERTREIMGGVVSQIARERGQAMAQRVGANDLPAFYGARKLRGRDDASEREILEMNDRRYLFNTTRCHFAEMYKEMGIPELGFLFCCSRDFPLCEGFNPNIKFTRTQTIMQGAPYCDFRYAMQRETEESNAVDEEAY